MKLDKKITLGFILLAIAFFVVSGVRILFGGK